MEAAINEFIEKVNDNKSCWNSFKASNYFYHYQNEWFCIMSRTILMPDTLASKEKGLIKSIANTEHHIIEQEYQTIDKLDQHLATFGKGIINRNDKSIHLHGLNANRPEKYSTIRWEFKEFDRIHAENHHPIFYSGHVFALIGQSHWDGNGFPQNDAFNEVNKVLWNINPPWENINDLGREIFAVPNTDWHDTSNYFAVIAPLPLTLKSQFSMDKRRNLISTINIGKGIDLKQCRLLLFGKGKSNSRISMPIIHAQSKRNYRLPRTIKVKANLENDSYARVMLIYKKHLIDKQEIILSIPNQGNIGLLMLSTFDENLNNLKEILENPKNRSIQFENAISLLLTMNGFFCSQLTGFGLHHEPDLLAFSSCPPALIIIECTTSLSNVGMKIQDLIHHRDRVYNNIPLELWKNEAYNWMPYPKVIALVATPLPEIELQVVKQDAVNAEILIFGRETIGRWLRYAIDYNTPDKIFNEIKGSHNGIPNG